MNSFSQYQSVFSWRYGSEEMRGVFSEEHKYVLWRKIWVALAEAEKDAGLVSEKELADLKQHQEDIDIDRILEIEKETRHDVVAAIKEFAEKAKVGGGKIHLGATSMDVVDNADAVRNLEALQIIEKKLRGLLAIFSKKIMQYQDIVCMAFTHLQPAEPTTVGYRLSFYAQDLLTDFQLVQFIKQHYKGKGIKGAVGTAAGYAALLGSKKDVAVLEKKIMKRLGISAATISTQVSSRKQDYLLSSLLSSICSSLAKFAGDVRILQSPPIGEWSEPFGKLQVGSSAMPFKRNPINAEKICSLERYVAALPNIHLENATLSYLERTLDDSANRRITTPDAFLATDEILNTAEKIISGLVINEKRIAYNLSQYAPFAASEAILMSSVKKGADRQKIHETLREIAMQAWEKVQNGEENPMGKLLVEHRDILTFLSASEIKKLLDVHLYIGTAPERSEQLVTEIRKALQ